ncbi:MAG: ATP-binding protein [Longimicrobiales bacterium]
METHVTTPQSNPATLRPSVEPAQAVQLERTQRDLEWLINSIDGIVWEGKPGTLDFGFVSKQAERLLGYPIEQWYLPNFWYEHLHPDDRAWVPEFCRNEVTEGRSHDMQYRLIAADGRTVWVRDLVSLTYDDPVRVHGIMVDVTAQRESEESLRGSYQQVQELARDLITAKEVERTRIARELHDGVNQQLATASIGLSALLHRVAARDRHEVQRLMGVLNQGITAIRTLSHELHPAVLQHSGLIAALRAHCAEFSRERGLQISLSVEGIDELRGELAVSLFRVVQEALRNVAQHAQATHVEVAVCHTGHDLSLAIQDDGRGFSTEPTQYSTGLGLISMEERVKLMNGTVEFSSTPGQGTRLFVRVPI